MDFAPAAPALPSLRQELRIEAGTPLVTGAPSWTLFDPVRHLFFQLGRIEFAILSRWASGSLAGIGADLAQDGLDEEESDQAISRVVEFSLANSLTVTPMSETVATFARQRSAARREWWRWLIDHYLFIRLPLVKPAAFLERTLPQVAPLWSRSSLTFFALLACVGFLLVARQWDAFMASFLYFFSLKGLMAYGLALGLVKIAHELGHAYTATRFGARVPAMGISLLVMMPVLYTDTTAAWRLTSRRQRLMIDIAGVTAELMIATVATLIWVMLPDGGLRSACFVLATTSWVTSLFINLSPFMRYDGYYILSDWLGVPNLQPRAFALARWQLREWLFNLREPPPEDFPQHLRRGLVVYAFVTWVYRLVLFLGIALLVYHLFFKLLGIILFVVEMVVFIARPFFNEFSAWFARRDAILGTERGRRWPWIIGALALLGVLPLDRHVSAPAILSPIGDAPLVAGDPARIDRILVRNGQYVTAGTPIMMLSAPELDRDVARHRVNITRIEAQMGRAMSDKLDLSNRSVLESELLAEREALASVEQRRARLTLRAPITGSVADIEDGSHVGRWLGGAETLARIVTPGRSDIQAYVDEDDVWRLDQDAQARFVPNDPVQASYAAKLVERATSAVSRLDQPMLASTNGGPIAVSSDEAKKLKPRAALYRVRLVAAQSAVDENAVVQPVVGEVQIQAAGRSLAGRFFSYVTAIFRGEAALTG
jgi:putative peptide zinc metalloprotease protein